MASTVHRANRPLVWELSLATAAMASYNLALLGVLALAPAVRNDFHLSAPQVGLMAAVPFFGAFVSAPPAGLLIDRLGASNVVAVSQLAVMAAMAIAATAGSFPALLLGTGVLGLASGLVNPATNVLAAALVTEARRGITMSLKQTGVTVGGAVAGMTLPATSAVVGWRLSLIVPATVAAIVCIWGVSLKTETMVRAVHHGPTGGGAISRERSGAFGFAMSGVQLGAFSYLAVYLVDERGFSPSAAGRAFAVLLATGGVGRLAWGGAADRLRSRRPILTATAIGSALALGTFPFARGAWVWPVLTIMGLCAVGWTGVYHAAVSESAGGRGVARATSFALFFVYSGSIAIPPILGWLVNRFGWAGLWESSALMAALSAVVLYQWRELRLRRAPGTAALTADGE